MNKTINNYKDSVRVISFIFIILFVYILLFEFILPSNKILPKPSILLETVNALVNEYSFFSSFIFTYSAIYFGMVITFLLIDSLKFPLIYFYEIFPKLDELFILGKYFIPLFLSFLFSLWFGDSLWGEYIFIFILLMGHLKSKTFSLLDSSNDEYILSARSLGLNEREIKQKVVWKSIQPKLFSSIQNNHISIWSLVLIYEFICQTQGIGFLFKLVIEYDDLSALILLIIFVTITFLIMEIILKSIKEKYFFW